MNKLYIGTSTKGHMLELKVFSGDGTPQSWKDYLFLTLIDTPANRIIATNWRDKIIEDICNSTHIFDPTNTIQPTDFYNYKRSFENQL